MLNLYLLMKIKTLITALAAFVGLASLAQAGLITKTASVSFFSHTPVEDIKADSYSVTSVLDEETGEIVFSVPMQSFEFPKALMQKHFNNSMFMNTKKYPRAKYKGLIQDFDKVNLNQDGEYNVKVVGVMTIKGLEQDPFEAEGTLTVSGGAVKVHSVFGVTVANFGVKMPKKKVENLAKVVEVTLKSEYKLGDS